MFGGGVLTRRALSEAGFSGGWRNNGRNNSLLDRGLNPLKASEQLADSDTRLAGKLLNIREELLLEGMIG